MNLIDNIINAINEFWNWLSNITGNLTNNLGELGSWLFGGLSYLGEKFKEAYEFLSKALEWIGLKFKEAYDSLSSGLEWIGSKFKEAYESLANYIFNGLSYLSDKFKEAYEFLSEYIGGAISFIGSGLTWIGNNIYSFGQWIWNSILNFISGIINIIEKTINFIWNNITNIWNNFVDFVNQWIDSINNFLYNWIKDLRRKFSNFITVNLTIPAIYKAYDKFIVNPNLKSFLGLFIAPFSGLIVSNLIDSIIPKPKSEYVQIFPTISIPKIEKDYIVIEKPEKPEKPTLDYINQIPIYYPKPYKSKLEFRNIIKLDYNITISTIKQIKGYSILKCSIEIQKESYKAIESINILKSNYYLKGIIIPYLELSNSIKCNYEIIKPFIELININNKIISDYNLFIKLVERGESHGFSSLNTSYDIIIEQKYINIKVFDYETNKQLNNIRIYYNDHFIDFEHDEILIPFSSKFMIYPIPITNIYEIHEFYIKYESLKQKELILELKDELGKPLVNAKVIVNNNTYYSNNEGKIIIKNIDKNKDIEIEIIKGDYYKKFILRIEK